MRGAPARSLASLTSQMARRVLVPPMSPARTCMVAKEPTRRGAKIKRRPCRRTLGRKLYLQGVARMRILAMVGAALLAFSTAAQAQLVETSIEATGDNNWSA